MKGSDQTEKVPAHYSPEKIVLFIVLIVAFCTVSISFIYYMLRRRRTRIITIRRYIPPSPTNKRESIHRIEQLPVCTTVITTSFLQLPLSKIEEDEEDIVSIKSEKSTVDAMMDDNEFGGSFMVAPSTSEEVGEKVVEEERVDLVDQHIIKKKTVKRADDMLDRFF